MSCSKHSAVRRRLRRVAAELRPAATAAGLTLRVAQLAPNHSCLLQTSADAKLIAANLPWYSAEYSPHDVPAFYDVSGLTEQPAVFQRTIDVLAARYSGLPAERAPTAIAGFDARGFIFGPPLALALGVPFVMIRKAGKLPGVLVSSGAYETEYSTDETVMRLGSVQAGDRVVLVDDLIATGGTAIAGFELVDQLGAEVLEFAAVVCLPGLGGVEATGKVRLEPQQGLKYRGMFELPTETGIAAARYVVTLEDEDEEDEATYDVLLAPMGVTADGRPVPHIAQNAFAAAAALSEPLRSVPAG